MRLIDADKLLEETRKDRDYAEKNGFLDMYYERQVLIDRIEEQPTAYNVDKVVEELLALNKNYNDGINLYEEVAEIPTEEAIEIVKQESEKYEEYYKDCGDCEAYNKEKHHCPKFCKVIKETVKEIEENHNDWISCSERLPKYGEVVMCYCTNSGITISCITHKGVKPSKSVRFGQHSVIAWQPLPQPYQPKGE